MSDITAKLESISKKIDIIEQQVTKRSTSNPALFVAMVTLFFIAMAFWTTAAIQVVERFHPTRKLYYWEYASLGLITLLFLYWLGNRTGIEISLISN